LLYLTGMKLTTHRQKKDARLPARLSGIKAQGAV